MRMKRHGKKRTESRNKTILEKDQRLAKYISYLIKRKRLSPEQVIEHLKQTIMAMKSILNQ